MKAYVATSWGNRDQARETMRKLRLAGHMITYDWTNTSPADYAAHASVRRMVSREELDAIERADVVIVLMPVGRGSCIEYGAALAQRKRTIVVGTAKDLAPDGVPTGFFDLASEIITPDELGARIGRLTEPHYTAARALAAKVLL